MQSEAFVLRSALRWNFLIMLPVLIVFVIFSSALFPIWIQESSASIIEVARIVALAALVDTICAPLLNSLWGRGLIRQTLVGLTLGTAICGITDLLLIPNYGLTSAAVGLLLGSLILAVHLIWTTSRFFGIGPLRMLADLRGFLVPGILCAVAGYTSMCCFKPAHWVSLVFATVPAWIAFFASFYVLGISGADRRKIRDLLRPSDETPVQLHCASDGHAN
jgi:O-antigen/teichoic acid export membrane protein